MAAELTWASWEEGLAGCTRCPLCEHRKTIVPGEGNREARIMFIGEGPGAQEDEEGRPFVGAAGQLLDKMLAAIGLDRTRVYIANVVKCRPPGNRTPLPEEADACLPYLWDQLELVHPDIIVTLGATAAKAVLRDPDLRITRERGRWHTLGEIEVMTTYHPSYLLRAPEHKREAWDDLRSVRERAEMMDLLPSAEG